MLTTLYLGSSKSLSQRAGGDNVRDESYRRPDSSSYPVFDLGASRPALSPEETDLRRKKGLLFDGQRLVTLRPHPEDSAAGVVDEEDAGIPALPTKESDLIVIGKVVSASAHLSNDQKGIYSEFDITVSEVLKSGSSFRNTKVLTMDRRGGTVRYPSGQTIVYFFEGKGLPRLQKEYLLFLQGDKVSPNHHIIRAFELKGDNSFAAVDHPLNFVSDGITGNSKAGLLADLRMKLSKKVPDVFPIKEMP